MARTNRLGMGCMVLFGLPFFAVGVFMLGWLGTSLWEWSQIRGWAEVPATILECDLKVSRGDDSDTYRVFATYRYEWLGETYTNDRVSITEVSDNFGSYHQDLFEELDRLRASNGTRPCRVDPADPTQAILDPSLRIGLALVQLGFGVVFGGVGVAVMAGGVIARARTKRRAQDQRKRPTEPWTWSPEWQSGVIPSRTRGALVFLVVFAGLWNLISWPITILAFSDPETEGVARLVVAIFPAVGLLLAYGAGHTLLRNLRYRRVVFEIVPNPAPLGGPLGGYVTIPHAMGFPEGVRLTLQCVRVIDGGEDRSERVEWEEELRVPPELIESGGDETKIPVLFAIPFDGTPSDPEGSPTIEWRLTVNGAVPGVDLKETFVVPVFRTEESREDFELDERIRDHFRGESDALSEFHHPTLRVGHSSTGGIVLRQPRMRQPGTALVLTCFVIGWTAVVFFLFSHASPIFAVVFGAFELLLIPFMLALWFETRTVRIEEYEVGLAGGLLIVGPETILPRESIRDVKVSQNGSAGSTPFLRIEVMTEDGKEHLAMTRVPSRALADRIAKAIQGED